MDTETAKTIARSTEIDEMYETLSAHQRNLTDDALFRLRFNAGIDGNWGLVNSIDDEFARRHPGQEF